MTRRNETTGKRAASKAGRLLKRDIDDAIHGLNNAILAAQAAVRTLEACKSVAGSALTQTEDKP